MLDDLFEADNAAAARDLIARPLPPPPKPGKFSAWSAIPRGVAVAAGEVGASLSDIAGAIATFRDTPSKQMERGGLPTAAFSSELGDSVRDYWGALKPDPQTASTAEQVLFGFSRGLTKLIPATIAAGPAGAIAAGVEEAMTVSDDLRRQGVPDGPRQIAGIIQGVGMGSAALPLLGRTLAETAALYVAGGPGGFMAQQALTRKVLENAGQEKIAGNYDPFDPIGLTVASAIPLVFTAAGLRGQKLRAEAKAQADFIAGPRPSEPTPVAAAVAEAVRAPELSPEVVDAAMVNNLRTFGTAAEAGMSDIQARVLALRAEYESLLPVAENLADRGQIREARKTLSLLEQNRPNESPEFLQQLAKEIQGQRGVSYKEALKQARATVAASVEDFNAQTERINAFIERNAQAQKATQRLGEIEKELASTADQVKNSASTAAEGQAQSATVDPIVKLNEPAGAPSKPLAAPIHDTVAARAADLESTMPDLVVRVDPDGRHVTLADDLAEVRRIAAEGTDDALGTLDADLLQVAVNCALSSGG